MMQRVTGVVELTTFTGNARISTMEAPALKELVSALVSLHIRCSNLLHCRVVQACDDGGALEF